MRNYMLLIHDSNKAWFMLLIHDSNKARSMQLLYNLKEAYCMYNQNEVLDTHMKCVGSRSAVGNASDSRARGPVQPHTFVTPSADSRRTVVNYWRKYVHLVLVNFLGDLCLPRNSVVSEPPRNSVVWFIDRPDMTIIVYRGRKATKQQTEDLKCIRCGCI